LQTVLNAKPDVAASTALPMGVFERSWNPGSSRNRGVIGKW